MIRTVLAVAAAAFSTTVLIAQTDPIAARRALMKTMGDQAKIGTAMSKGEAPFDLAKAQAIFVTYADHAQKLSPLFPDTSKTGGETAAHAKIWESKSDFDAKLKKLGDDAQAAPAKVKDLDSFKATYSEVLRNCGGCHETYRIKKS
jgi:cytochrome c556